MRRTAVGIKPLSKPMMTLIIDTDASYGGWHQAIQGWGEYTNPEYEYEYEYFA